MKHFLQFCAAAALAFVSGACSDEPFNGQVVPPQSDGALSVPYEVDGEMPLARGVATTTHETRLEHAYVLFFDTEDSDNFVGYQSVTVPSGKNNLSFDPPESLQHDRDYRVLALGNADSYCSTCDYGAEMIAKFQGSYNDALGYFTVGMDKAVTSNNPGRLPLWGQYVDEENSEKLFRITTDAEDKVVVVDQGRFYFSRAICRVDLHNLVGHMLDIRYALVVNTRTEALAFDDGLNKGSIKEFVPATAPDGEGYMPITVDMVPGTNTTQRLEGSLYAFPNIVNTSVVNDKETTALLIAGYYIENGTKDTKLTYYRFNLANLGESQVLKRNYCYRATIKGVRRRGAEDPKTAFNDASPIFEYNVDEEWGATDDNVVTDKDGNFLIVNKTHLTFKGDATEADFVELRVSTNPELEWEIRKVEQQGQSNNRFDFEKLSNQAVKCGPNSVNDSPYVLYGYYEIVAKNTETGKVLKMPIYLMQLSTMNNVKTLTVNGNTGTFTQELDPMGGTVRLKVVTGGVQNSWSCQDYGNSLMSWDTQGIKFTRSGGDGTTLEITVPANFMEDERTARLIVSLDDDPEGKVQPVTILLNQKRSSQLMDIVNFPSGGQLDIECLDLTPNYNANGVVNAKNFIVRLTSPEYRYRVISEFDKNRDLLLSATNSRMPNSSSPAYASHPANGAVVTDKLEGLTNEQQFWINPFRTGPGDPIITGTITIEAYHPTDSSKPTEKRSFTVNLLSQEMECNDVIVGGEQSGTYMLLPDRNLGINCRTQPSGEIYTAQYYTTLPGFKITGRANASDVWLGTKQVNSFRLESATAIQGAPSIYSAAASSQFIIDNAANGYWYTDKNFEWYMPSINEFLMVNDRTCFSKGRAFVLSVFPMKRGSKEIPVYCWLPYFGGYHHRGGNACYYACRTLPSYPAYYTYAFPALWMSQNKLGGDEYKYAWSDGGTLGDKSWTALIRPVTLINTTEKLELLEKYKREQLGY